MRYQVPQFIDVEDKLFGPLTFTQFAYVVGGVGAAFLIFQLWGLLWAILIGGPIFAFGLALAFIKINSRPFIETVRSAFYYSLSSRLYLWRKEEKKQKNTTATPLDVTGQTTPQTPKLTEGKLKEIAWSLDIKNSMYSDENELRQ